MEHRSTKLIAIVFIGLCVFAATVFYFLYSKPQAFTAERVAFLVTEMTKTPDRQQEALCCAPRFYRIVSQIIIERFWQDHRRFPTLAS